MIDFSFIPAPKTVAEASFQARVMARAQELFEEGGYTYNAVPTIPGTFYVHSPEGACYVVDARPEFRNFEACGCECWQKNHFCKHLIAILIELKIAEEEASFEAQAEAYDAFHAANPLIPADYAG